MITLNDQVEEYAAQLRKGDIQCAYRGILKFMSELKAYLENKYPAHSISSLYIGYMDMTYFAFTPSALKDEKLKIAIVFLHEKCKFEAWLAGANRKIQAETAARLKYKDLGVYTLSPACPGVDSIIETALSEQPNFDDPIGLISRIEEKTLRFIDDILPLLQ